MKRKKTICITGGASGIGAATVKLFIYHGWNVCFIDIDEQGCKTLMESLKNTSCLAYRVCDVSDIDAMQMAVEDFVTLFDGLDAVFGNAGIHFFGDILHTSTEQWERMFDVNLKGVYFTVKATLPYLVKQRKGAIVLMGSDQSLIAKKKSFAYGITKGAIAQMTKSLALDYAQDNIRVNCVCPSTIDTALSKKALTEYAKREYQGDVEKVLKLEASEFPLGRLGRVEEVAKVVYFLISDDSSYMTGTLIPIDGGYTAQ